MALPAILLKAKKAVTAAQAAKSVKDSGAGEAVVNTAMGLGKKVTLIAAITIAPFFFFTIFVALAVGFPERIYTIYGAVGGDSNGGSGTSSSCGGTINSYIEWAKNTADDDTHGYDMNNRGGSPDYDCSSFVYYALKDGAGISTDILGTYAFDTESMDEPLKKAGFEKHEFNGEESELQVGDILWYPNGYNGHVWGHTEIYIGEGKTIGAHSNYDGKTGDSQGNEIAAVDGNWSKYSHYYRLTSDSNAETTCNSGGNGKILILAGHTFCSNCSDAREKSTSSGYIEPEETRKLAKKVQSSLTELGVTSDIGNALLAGDNDRMDASFWLAYEHSSECSDKVNKNFKKYNWGKYKYVIEIHFNAANKKTSGTCLMQYKNDKKYVSDADDDIVKAITKYTGKSDMGWCSSSISNTADQTYFHKKDIPMTYVEVEFYDNKKAMDKYSKHIDEIAKGIAKAIKKHYG